MKNARRIFSLCFAAAALGISVTAAGFSKINTYDQNQFSDVSQTEWYASDVKNTYELGLMNGTGNGIFNPKGNVTIAEAITMASRARSINANETIKASEGGEWYKMYVDYATEKGFIKEGQFDSFTRAAKRHEVAKLFEDALPAGYFSAKNTVKDIPDVSQNQPYYEDLLNLYKAGVVMGSDPYGNFFPENNITRAEAAAIINRVALPESRLTKKLDIYSTDEAYTLVYNDSYDSWGAKEGINSGWTLDNRGGAPRSTIFEPYGSLADVSTQFPTAMIREFNNTTTGNIVLKTRYTISNNNSGVYIEFRNAKDNSVYRLEIKNGYWNYLNADGSYTPIYKADGENTFGFEVHIDLDNNRSTTIINNNDAGSYPLAATGSDINLQNFRYGTTEESTSVVSSTFASITVNYAVNDTFILDNSDVPYGWTGKNTKASGSLTVLPGGSATKYFTPVSGIVVAETKFFLGNGQKTAYSFFSGSNEVASFTTDENNFYVNGTKVYENYSKTVRYTFRLEMDTDTSEILVKVNGRKVATIPFAQKATSVDTVIISNKSTTDNISVPYIRIFERVMHEDYVPVPVKPAGQEKYNVGINVCSLWHNGMHSGWSCISPYDDIKPVLGYYDEGNPETADWEIKYMVEHGIDFQAFCWFAGENTVPINNTPNDYQLRDGYMNARYSDMMSYCLIWEASSGAVPKNMQQWKDFFVPYWIEHFFKDSRYTNIDGYLPLYIFTPDKIYGQKGFGSTALTKEAFDYLDSEVQKLGFKGMLYIGSHASSNTTLLEAGFDATAAYNWSTDGNNLELTKNRNLSNAKDNSVYTIPTVSVGFNNVGWAGTRSPLMTSDDFKAANLWARDEFSPEYAQKDTWQQNLFMIATWNEYGEGTYIMPCEGLCGFEYLDALREVFTEEKANASLNNVPTDEQKKRITRLYPQHKTLLRKNGDYKEPEKVLNLDSYKSILSLNPGTHPGGVNPKNITQWEKNEAGLKGVTENSNNYIAFGNGNSLDLSKASLVKVTAKIPKDRTMRLYFTTTDDSTWNESKATNAQTSTSDELYDYYFDFSENPSWKGTLQWYRIDPTASTGDAFEITNVEFLGTAELPAEEKTEITINGKEVKMQIPPKTNSKGEYLIAFDPAIGLEFLLNCYHIWDEQKQILTINTCSHTVIYTVGSDKYIVDGKPKALKEKLGEFDGLPMIPVEQFCKDVGYTFSLTNDGAVITTTEKAEKPLFFNASESRIPYSWEFNVNGDSEGWTTPHMSTLSSDGYLSCKSISTYADPAFTKTVTPFEAQKYNKLQIRVRYNYTPVIADVKDEQGNPTGEKKERNESLTLYFATTQDASFSEAKTIKLPLNSSSGSY